MARISLSERGKQRSRMASPGGPMYSFLRGITHEWRVDFPEGVCQLDVSENDLMVDELLTIIKALVMKEDPKTIHLSGPVWPCSSHRLLDAACLLFDAHFNPESPVDSSQIVAGAGCSLLLEGVARTICDPGDVILTPAPYWPVFSWLVGKAEVTISAIPAPPSANDTLDGLEKLLFWSDETERAWESHIQSLVGRPKGRPRALLLSNPQNPIGRCYSRDFLEGALAFCEKHDLFLISDEVFALSVHGGTDNGASTSGFTSVLAIDLNSRKICDPRRIIVLWSVSKDLGASGARVAFVVTPKELPDLRNALMSIAPSFRVSSLADNLFAAFFTAARSSVPSCIKSDMAHAEDEAGSLISWYISTNRQKLSAAKCQLQEWCRQRRLRYLDADAGNFLMINLEPVIRKRTSDSDRSLENNFHSHLLSEGVALQPGGSSMFPGFGWARVTFSRGSAYMTEGLSRLDRAFDSWKK